MDSVVRLNERGCRRGNLAPIYMANKRTLLPQDHQLRPRRMDPPFWTPTRHAGPTKDHDCGIFVCLYAAFLDIRLPLSFSQHDTRNVRTWMAHEMIEEGKLLKMIYNVLHDSLLATATDNSATSPDNSTTIGRTTTETVDTQSTATTKSQGDLKRQKTYELENEITKPPDLTNLNHQQQKSPDTENTETQQGGHTHHIPKEPSATIGERQITHALDTESPPQKNKGICRRVRRAKYNGHTPGRHSGRW